MKQLLIYLLIIHINILPQFENMEDIDRNYYPIDSHPPRETDTYLSEIQAYLL